MNTQPITPSTQEVAPKPAPSRAATVVAAAALAGVLAFGGYQTWRNNQLEDQISHLQSSNMTELTAIKQLTAASAAATRQTLDELNDQLRSTQTRAEQATAMARNSSAAVEKRTRNLLTELTTQQKSQQSEVEQTLEAIRSASEANAAKVGEVATEVGSVKTEVATHKTQLDTALADLKSVRGDMGVQSGLIATNATELASLRELGERNYYEFNIAKSDKVKKVGGINLALRKADMKRSKFNLDVIADDRKIEKKDKTMNEPVQFYVQGARQPLELVVNQIQKDRIIGYLAVPKTIQARR
jgi:chromosome segregation ATPase